MIFSAQDYLKFKPIKLILLLMSTQQNMIEITP